LLSRRGRQDPHETEVDMSEHRRRYSSIAFIALALASAGCSGGSHSTPPPPPPSLSGAVLFIPDSSTIPGVEPNDTIDRAQSLGVLAPGSSIAVRGQLTPPSNAVDGFTFVAPRRVEVTATILGERAGDIDLLVYDRVALQYVAHANDGTVVFHADGACDVVLRAKDAGGAYALRLVARASDSIELDPRATAYGGGLAVGDRVTLKHAGWSRVRLSATEDLSLHVAGAPAMLRDVTVAGSEAALTDLVPALTLIEIDVGDGSADVVVEARAAPFALQGRLTGANPRIAPREQELAFDARAAGAFYGSPKLEMTPGRILVREAEGAKLDDDLASRACRIEASIPGDAHLVAFDLGAALSAEQRSRATLAMIASFATSPRVRYSEPNLVRHAFGGPNDTYFHLQWHYPLIHLPEAWGITTGSDNVIVAVIDTGQTNHPDLVNRQIAGYDFISDPTSAGDGDGIDSDPTDVGDGNGVTPNSFHGTHVAGTIGAETNNNMGVAGVTWSGKLMHLRVLGKQGGTDFDIANAVRYAAQLANDSQTTPPQRANVINMSLGGPGSTATMQSAITAARAQGVVIFAAAGNQNSSQPSFPGAYDGVISVAAVDINAQRAPYSNFGPTIDLCAPGGNVAVDLDHDGHPDGVLSTLMDGSTNPFTPIYAYYDGTSMATPHASGVAALMLAVNPSLTPDQIEAMMESTATDLGAPGRDDLYGFGLVNAYAAVLAAQGGTSTTPILALSPTTLSFGANDTALSAQVTNIGGGALDVTGVAVSTTSGGNWLSASTVPASGSGTTNVSSVSVTVDRTGLAAAQYDGSVQVTSSNGGDKTLQVSMVVPSTAPPPNVQLFVLAVDATTFATKGQAVVNPSTNLAYAFTGLPPGDYILVCGSDDDGNMTICDPGDVYCGVYPTMSNPQAVAFSNASIGDLDFPVSAQSTMLARGNVLATIRAHGVHRLQ
jgi:subtilisin family serine protease